jgi:septal ring factor EnvC (AmiA/AmiB activator)
MLAFLNPRVWLALVIVGAVAFGTGFWKGAQYADRKAEIAALNQGILQRDAVIKEHQRQAQALKDVTEQAEQRAALAEQAARENSDEVERYAQKLAELPEPVCNFTADDVRVLNSLARSRRGTPLPPTVSR